jgi:hypothetical protein
MKKNYLISIIALFAIVVSCVDESLDPLKFKEVKKGTIIALRGKQLDNLYNKGLPGAEVFPKIATGTEKFTFDAEFLSADQTSLSSVDVYVIKGVGAGSTRVLMKNVPFSEFKQDGTYTGAWTTISMDFKDILAKIGLANTFDPNTLPHLPAATVTALLGTYGFGINIECDLNLTDGSKVTAAEIVAAGLFGSNQFYPAMKLNYAMTDYCSYVESSWGGSWVGDEVGVGVGGNDKQTFASVGANKWKMNNFFGDGTNLAFAVIEFTPSVDPASQVVKYVNDAGQKYQLISDCGYSSSGCVDGKISGDGTYNQCTGLFSLNTTYVVGTATYKWVYNFHRP